MKKALSVFSCLLSIIVIASYGQTEQEFKTTPQSVIGYIEYIPPDYENNSFEYPLVIFLHGLGQRGPNSTDPEVLKTGYNNLVSYGPPKLVKTGTQFPFILVSPALKSNYGDWPSWYVMEVIEHLRTYLRIDPKRIYLTGSSLGGGGTWWTAQDHPDYFAAIAPVMGSRNSTGKACNIARSNLPVWAFHGDQDRTVPLSRSVAMVDAINACNPGVKAKLTIYEGVAHSAHKYAYDLSETYHSPDLYSWMLQWESDHGNKIPKADAGSDISTSAGSTITIQGKGSDPDGSITNYSWTMLKGPGATLTGRTSKDVSISGLQKGTYVFRLTVRDNNGAIASDDITVLVDGTGNAVPIVNAGSDKTITLPTNSIEITGTASDPDGKIASYAWTKVSGGNAVLSGAATAKLTVTGLQAGNYTFRLTVKDNAGASKSDDVKVFVNNPPTVNAGSDVTLTLPDNALTIKGTASDSDGSIKSYTWNKVSGPALKMSGASGADLTISDLVEGKYVLRLTVTDNHNAPASDDITVTVLSAPAPGNNAPTANAGANKIITLPQNTIKLSGGGSDTDGEITSYQWTKVSGGAATITNAGQADVSISGLVAGVYTFRLTVTDDRGATASDDVTVTINRPPVANAGPDRVISLPVNKLNISGSGTDPDGQISSYRWTRVSGGNATLSGTGSATLQVSDLEAGEYVFRLEVKDNHNAVHTDDVRVRVNTPPRANAGADKKVILSTSPLEVKGSGSDTDGSIVSYAWRKVSGGSVKLGRANTENVSLTGLAAGVYVLELTVTDNDGATHADQVKITVVANQLPVANAGPDKVISLPENSVVLKGSGSDPDGKIVEYLWEKVSGKTAVISEPGSPNVTITGLTAGNYVFSLTVTDNSGGTNTSTVKVKVNKPPVASAGEDKLVHVPESTVVLEGTASDSDGTIASVNWTKIAGGSVSLAGNKTNTLTVAKLKAGIYHFRFTIVDNDGASHSDDVQVVVNRPPVVDAGDDVVVKLPENTATLQGVANDADGEIKSWAWKKVSGGAMSWKGRTSSKLSLSGLQAGTYVFRLEVTDDRGGKSADDVTVVVEETNEAPVADAGPDHFLMLPVDSLTIVGSGSDDADGLLAFEWTQVSGAPVTMTDVYKSSVHVSGLHPGVYTFRLTVTDGDGASHSDDVVVTVDAAPETEEELSNPILMAGCAECVYYIWGQNLQELHAGPWQEDTYEKVFSTPGLYYFNVRRGGETIRRGKIFRYDR